MRAALLAAAIALAGGALSPPVAGAEGTRAAEEAFASGEAALDAGDAAAAEAHYRRAIEIEPTHLRALIRLATVVSWSDRLGEASVLFERALALDPGSAEAKLGLARVASWAGDHGRAIALYEEARRENPGSREAALGLARTHGWAGRHKEARRLYLEVLSGDPSDVEARNGLAAVLSWEGRLDESLALYEETLAIHPGDRDALSGRARVLHWQGRTPEAWKAVDEALRLHPGDRDAVRLENSLREGLLPFLDASAGVVHDSDRNAFTALHVGLTYHLTPAATGGVAYDRFEASLPAGGSARDEARLETFKGLGSYRARPGLLLSGSLGLERITRTGGSSATVLTGSAGADRRLGDRWTLAGSISRETFAGTARALDAGVRLDAATVTAGWTPLARLVARLTLQHAFIRDPLQPGDRNARDLAAGYVRWAVPARRPRLGLSWSGRLMSYDHAPGTGYFAPDSYQAHVLGLDAGDRLGRRFSWNVEGTLGLQRVDGGDSDAVTGYHVAATWDFGRGVGAEVYAGRTNLALQAGTGFRSTESGVRLRWRIGAEGGR